MNLCLEKCSAKKNYRASMKKRKFQFRCRDRHLILKKRKSMQLSILRLRPEKLDNRYIFSNIEKIEVEEG
jgi:hypothetical protein